MKETFQRNNGITIIALAITIIVLLILAGISIAMLSGDNGTIKQANKAKEQTEIQAEKENIDISVIEVLGQKTNGMMEKSDKDKFEENLRKNYNNQKIDVSVLENQDPYIFEVTYLESKRKYYVTIDGDFNESIEKRLTIEYKTTDGKTISKKMLDYTKEEITVGELELSEEIKEENKYEFQSAEIEKADGSKEQVSLTDKIILDENINKVLITYNQKIIKKSTVTMNPGQGSITGEKTKEGESGTQITIPTPTPPSGYNVTLNPNEGQVSQTTIKSTYSFDRWSLTGGGKINGNIYTFGEQNGTLTASYTHKGITLPTPTKDGYTFKGWYTSSSGGTKVGDAGNIYTPTSNITLYARWADETAPVITNLYAGVDTVTIEATDAGSGITKYAVSTNSIPNNFTQVENTKNLRTTVYGLNEGTTYYVCVQDEAGNQSEFKTITTSKIPRFTLTINPGQGSITGSTTKEGINGEQITIPTPTPPSGYNVTLNANGGYVSQTTMKSTYSFNSWSLTGGGTIYGNTYTFGSQDGMLTASYRHTGITLPRPTKDRYTFKGWYTSSSGGTKVGDAGNIYTPTNNVTLYARWEAQIPSLITNTNVWFTPDITTWTNQDVNVSVTTTETNWTLQLTTGNPLEESSWISANRITVKENGTIYARLTDGQTSGGYASYNINNIDKTPPKKLVKGILTITRDNVKNNAYLNLNVINELESGVAKIECFYKTELDSYYSQQTIIEYAPMYGSQTGMVTESGRQTCTINSDRFSGQTIYMYAEIWDVAGNMSRTWLATISPDGHTTTYTEI